jgi:hypothetical protein
VPKENDLEGPQDQGGKHGGQAGCRSTLPVRPIKALCAMSAARNSRGTKNEHSKSAAKTRGTIRRARSASEAK